MKYSVKTLRAAGLEAKWTRNRNGAPIIVARQMGASIVTSRTWWHVDRTMWDAMKREGIIAAFERFTLLGDIFSVPA